MAINYGASQTDGGYHPNRTILLDILGLPHRSAYFSVVGVAIEREFRQSNDFL